MRTGAYHTGGTTPNLRLGGNVPCILLVLALSLPCTGCETLPAEPAPSGGSHDELWCNPPSATTLKAVGVPLEFLQDEWSKLVKGDPLVSRSQRVLSMAGRAASHPQIRDYMECLAIYRDGYTFDQLAYMRELATFVCGEPSRAEFLAWQRRNRIPTAFRPIDGEYGEYVAAARIRTWESENASAARVLRQSLLE